MHLKTQQHNSTWSRSNFKTRLVMDPVVDGEVPYAPEELRHPEGFETHGNGDNR
jgi:hypothetical protein